MIPPEGAFAAKVWVYILNLDLNVRTNWPRETEETNAGSRFES